MGRPYIPPRPPPPTTVTGLLSLGTGLSEADQVEQLLAVQRQLLGGPDVLDDTAASLGAALPRQWADGGLNDDDEGDESDLDDLLDDAHGAGDAADVDSNVPLRGEAARLVAMLQAELALEVK